MSASRRVRLFKQTTGEGGRAINNKQTHVQLGRSEYDIRGELVLLQRELGDHRVTMPGGLPIRLSLWACSLGVQLSNQLDINGLVPSFSFKFVEA